MSAPLSLQEEVERFDQGALKVTDLKDKLSSNADFAALRWFLQKGGHFRIFCIFLCSG